MSYLILITGLPATGKTSFAEYLSKNMKIPMVSKDVIKEHLYDTIGFKNRAEKVTLGVAAMDIMYHFAKMHLEVGQPLILENNFEDVSKPGLEILIDKYKCKTITIRFCTDINVLIKRFLVRDRSPERHRGHVVNTQYPEIEGAPTLSMEAQAINPEQFLNAVEQRGMLNFSIGGEEIVVDTTDFSKVSYKAILLQIKEKLSLPY